MRSRFRLNAGPRVTAYRGICGLLIAIALFAVPTWPPHLIGGANSYLLSVIGLAAIWAMVATGTAMFVNLTGLPTLAHAGLWGVGAYASGLTITHLHIGFWPSLFFAAVAPAVVALPIALISLRTNGVSFLVVTIAFSEFIVLVLTNWTLTGGDAGLAVLKVPGSIGPLHFDGLRGQYYLFLFFLAATIALYWAVNRSAFGARLRAARDDESLALSLGLNVRWQQLLIFELTAAVVGLGGALLLVNQQAVTPGLFDSFQFIPLYLAMMLGGLGMLAGPSLGAWIAQFLPVWIGSSDPNLSLLIYGVILVAAMILIPNGILGTLSEWVGRGRAAAQPADEAPPDSALAEAGPAPALAEQLAAHARPARLGEVVLQARGIRRWFGANKALDEVDFEVREGEIRGLIGPNGSGKTTLLNCVSGFIPLTDGSVTYAGRTLTGLRPDAVARLGLVRTFQSPHLFESFTARETCALVSGLTRAADASTDAAAAETDPILQACGLTEQADVPVAALPYGQARLLGVAAAMASRPRVILLDEPAAGLARGETDRLCEVILEARRRGVSVVVIDHDMSFLLRICDAVTVLDGGKRLTEGRPEEIMADPAVVAAYLGESFVKRQRDAGHPAPLTFSEPV